ncbi:macrophage mannose receptor 1 [Coregonus clupeaformis]|uniref:macrophage mannose receptor 1 n=1 Tax=Coregonus clupeaformis TaxID=59861 RepID=UPI001BE0D56D|nr:macrophage mannose receptor 1 [Coregonus clupeaformis]
MTAIMITVAVLLLFIQTTLEAPETDGRFILFNAASGIKQGLARWVSGGRLYYPSIRKCAGVSGKTEGSTLVFSDCDEKSHLQQWECSNHTLLNLKGQTLYLHINDNNDLVLSRDMGPRSHWIVFGTTDGPCSRTHRELFTIEGNAFGHPCQFPFLYKDQWYGDCTLMDSSVGRLWCATETNYQDNELWGYCPSKSMEHWHKNPVTGAFYQVNLRSALTWHQARTSCQQQGADLASITAPHEQSYLSGLFGREHVPLWTGLNALEQDSGWQWSSGKPLRYFRWDSGHPLPDPGQICGLVNPAQQSYWQSSLCSKSLGYVCQKDPPTAPVQPEEAGSCSGPWIPYAARCYRLQRTKKTWTEAQMECRKDGGDLASIHNIEQLSFVMSQLGYAAADELWIGMNDVKTPLLFEWSDQSPVTYTRWEEAMLREGNCVLVRGEQGRWATQVCENQHGFICMKKSSSQPSGDQVNTNPGCKLHWTRHGSYCYFVGPETKTFDEAKETCKRSQSYLADVSSRVDNAFLISLVGSRAEQHFWIGLSNQNHIDVFTWTNSNRVRYTHWNAQMPGSRQGCVAMTTGTLAGLWDVLSCTNQEKYICKHLAEGAGPTPEPITPVPPRCHEDWYPVGTRNYCFKFFTQPHADEKTWFEARDYCRVIGGDLLSIHSSTDLQSMNHVHDGIAWIGLSAQDPNAGYTWTDGSPLSFQHWMEGEPNNYNGVESCAEMRNSFWDEEGSWNDVNCEGYNDWLCEIPKGVTPLPPPNNTVPEYNVTEDGWLEYGGSQYYFNTEMLAMEDARYYCQQRHGDLVVINGQNENTFLWKKIHKERLGNHYIGLTVDLDRSFGWMDGSPVVYQRWDNNQPDFKNNDENCVAMYASMGFWHDYNCGTQMRSICERIGSPPANSTVAPTAPPTGGCPPEWTLYQSKCYKLIGHRVPSTWLEARSFCQSMGANLASIANRREQVFLTTQMTSVATDLWIGLSNLNRDRFVWTDGQAVKYLNWDPNKNLPPTLRQRWHQLSRNFLEIFVFPSNKCFVMASSSSILGKWQHRSCNDAHGFICQRKVDSGIPIPAPTALPRGWVKLANDSYMVLPRNQTWPEARKQCEAEEGQLASTLDELSVAYLELQALKLQSPLWIGLNRNETQGYFRWMDGWPLSLAKWAQDEPSRDRPCVYLDVEGTWKTALCNHTYPSVCKQSSAVPPTASSQYPGECIQEEEEIGVWNSPWSWLPFRGHCYSFVNDDIEWAYASTSCIRKGASLVSIEDPEELYFIKSNMELLKDSYSSFWIGLYKTHLGKWQWVDQTVLDYINWAEGQPYDSTQNNYGEMLSSDGSWSTAPRWDDKPYICKKPKVLLETLPTDVSLKGGQRRVYSGLAVVVVLASLCLMGLTALMLYKKTGRPLPSFTKPLVFSAGWRAFDNPLYTEPVTEVDVVNPSTVDTSQLVKHMEEQAQPMITL